MRFETEMVSDTAVVLRFDSRHVATFHMDYVHQLSTVVINELTTSPAEQLEVLRLAAAHVMRYVVRRSVSALGGIMIKEARGKPDRFRSLETLVEAFLPEEVQSMDSGKLIDGLRQVNIPVIMAIHADPVAGLTQAVEDLSLRRLVTAEVLDTTYDGQLQVRFTATGDRIFKFWKSASKPSLAKGLDLHIVPAYHPVMQGYQSLKLINGATTALISSDVVRYIQAPEDSQSGEFVGSMLSSWNSINHPYRAEGRSFVATVSPLYILSEDGVSGVVNILSQALMLNNQYLPVSGGFQSPLGYPGNVARRCGIRPGTHRGEARGSESHCAWTYHVLQQEGELEAAYVPEWFMNEGWLRAYPSLPQPRSAR